MTKDIARLFYDVCNWAYEAWVTHKCLFENNDKATDILQMGIAFSNRLSTITQEYALQQIAKLHDPAEQKKDANVSIDFVVKFGEWGCREPEIEAIEERLVRLWGYLKPARNKLLAHNDLAALQENEPLGAFPEGEDDLYFAALQELVDAVHDRWGCGGPSPFNDLAKLDVCEFLSSLEQSNTSI